MRKRIKNPCQEYGFVPRHDVLRRNGAKSRPARRRKRRTTTDGFADDDYSGSEEEDREGNWHLIKSKKALQWHIHF